MRVEKTHTISNRLAPYRALRVVERDVRFDTEVEMRAGIEMQTSGEPFAEFIGRTLAGYDRNARDPDEYADDGGIRRDPTGYAAAVESYEYSRQPMNNVAFESGAGVSMVFSRSLARRASATDRALGGEELQGRDALDAMRALVSESAIATRAGMRVGPGERPRGFVTIPLPEDNPLNRVGFGGLWATSLPYASFDPTIRPSNNVARGCTIEGGYGALAGQSVLVGDYECGYSSLHLPSRFGQVERSISAGATGAALWKYGLWITNYLQLFHDGENRAIARIDDSSALASVGVEGNTVAASREDGTRAAGGVFLGSSDIEGFQGALLIASTLASTEWVLARGLTRDGRALDGGLRSIDEANTLREGERPRWMPARIDVDETEDSAAGFEHVTSARIAERAPSLRAQLELVAGFATLFALVDDRNPEVGASATARAYFDGAPFDRAHARDRWLTGLRWALVTLEQGFATERGVFRSDSIFAAETATTDGGLRGNAGADRGSITVEEAALAVQVLRLARRSITGRLVLYGDATPDGRATRSVFDGEPLFEGQTAIERLEQRARAHAELLFERLTSEDGTVRTRWNFSDETTPTAELTSIEHELAAARGLLEAFLATGEVRFRERALRVWHRIERERWDEQLGMYRTGTSRDDRDDLRWSAMQWAHYTGAAREVFKLIGSRPGEEQLGRQVLARWTRSSKLILNGWNDANRDDRVQWPSECVNVRDGIVRGGLQMAERALTGELGSEGEQPTADRDHDCVPEIDDAALPAALANSVRFEVVR